MDFVGSGQRLSGDDYARAAAMVGCEEAAIRAVCAVEARGSGFDARNRPVILFEPHVFDRNLSGESRRIARERGLSWPTWRPGAYPATQDARYAQLFAAMAIDESAALKAASWGLGQVLGENWQVCTYASVQAMVSHCVASEGGQLDVMVAFIMGRRLDKYLRAKDWAGFARGYNGSRFAENAYDRKLAAAYQRALTLAPQPPVGTAMIDGVLSIGDKGPEVVALQRALGAHADGDFGPITEQAVKAFQKEHGLSVDGKVGRITGGLLGLPYWQ